MICRKGFNMKRMILIAMMCVCGSAMAELNSYWLAAYTQAYPDTTPSSSEVGKYVGYYCTVEAAQRLFGGAGSYSAVANYLANNYSAALASILTEITAPGYVANAKADVGQLSTRDFVDGQYGLKVTYGDPLIGSTYLALLFYDVEDTQGFRVMENDPWTMAEYGSAYFSDDKLASTGHSTDWQQASVPEPTSAMLLLFGVAGLALKRKRTPARAK